MIERAYAQAWTGEQITNTGELAESRILAESLRSKAESLAGSVETTLPDVATALRSAATKLNEGVQRGVPMAQLRPLFTEVSSALSSLPSTIQAVTDNAASGE